MSSFCLLIKSHVEAPHGLLAGKTQKMRSDTGRKRSVIAWCPCTTEFVPGVSTRLKSIKKSTGRKRSSKIGVTSSSRSSSPYRYHCTRSVSGSTLVLHIFSPNKPLSSDDLPAFTSPQTTNKNGFLRPFVISFSSKGVFSAPVFSANANTLTTTSVRRLRLLK